MQKKIQILCLSNNLAMINKFRYERKHGQNRWLYEVFNQKIEALKLIK